MTPHDEFLIQKGRQMLALEAAWANRRAVLGWGRSIAFAVCAPETRPLSAPPTDPATHVRIENGFTECGPCLGEVTSHLGAETVTLRSDGSFTTAD